MKKILLILSAIIESILIYAFTKGCDGKGSDVVFAVGNNNGTIIYPAARSNPAVLAVAAMSPCGERKNPSSCDQEDWWGSCFGDALDIAAPGVLIPTTDLTGADGMPERPNGSWHEEMGYGLVDTKECVQIAKQTVSRECRE